MSVLGSQVQWDLPVQGGCIDGCRGPQQQPHRLQPALPGRIVQWAHAIAVLDVNSGLSLQEQGYELQAAPQGGMVESRKSISILVVDIESLRGAKELCLCSLDLSHQFLHTSHISILNSEDQILFTTHSGPWAPETRAEAEKMVLAEASGCHALAFWRARRSGGVCLCPRQWASC